MINIFDYFRKYGFEDGDDEELLNKAEILRPLVAKMVTKKLTEINFGGNIKNPKMVECEVETAHNTCRAMIVWSSGNVNFEWDQDCGVQVDCGDAGAQSVHGRMQPARGWVQNDPSWIKDVLEKVQKEVI